MEDILSDSAEAIFRPLPQIEGWLDDNHYLEIREDSGGSATRMMSVDVTTGAATFCSQCASAGGPSYEPKENEVNATVSPDGKRVAFTRGNNLFVRDLATAKETRLTDDGASDVYNGYASWLYEEEILGHPNYKAFWWSPDSRRIAYMHFDETRVPVSFLFADGGHADSCVKQHYPKPGEENPRVRIGIVDVDSPVTVWADFDEGKAQYFGLPVWNPSGSSLWVLWTGRRQQDLKIYAVDPSSGKKKEIYDEQQKTWIDLEYQDRVTFLNNGEEFILSSDRSGWMQLYLYNKDGTLVNPITKGEFTVREIVYVDDVERKIFFTARKENSTRIDLYKEDLDGTHLKRLTFGEYSHDYISISPHGRYFITTYSNHSTPWKIALVDANGRIIRQLGDSRGRRFGDYAFSSTQLMRLKTSDSLFSLPMLITWPKNFQRNRKYPVLVTVYGGPGVSRVYDRWRPDYLWSQWWAGEGLIQVAVDNRTSGHFGRSGVNYCYRQLGLQEIRDFLDCGRWLRSQPFVDTARIAITGSSFGGYMTCMALTYGADVFKFGLSIAPVTSWALYDSYYTEKYMGSPAGNDRGYRETSPLAYAQNYKGLLRIVHGLADDNVHLAHSLELINRLEDDDRQVEFMVYPEEHHTIRGIKAIHLRNENAQFIYTHLLEKPMPEAFWSRNYPGNR